MITILQHLQEVQHHQEPRAHLHTSYGALWIMSKYCEGGHMQIVENAVVKCMLWKLRSAVMVQIGSRLNGSDIFRER